MEDHSFDNLCRTLLLATMLCSAWWLGAKIGRFFVVMGWTQGIRELAGRLTRRRFSPGQLLINNWDHVILVLDDDRKEIKAISLGQLSRDVERKFGVGLIWYNRMLTSPSDPRILTIMREHDGFHGWEPLFR